MKCVRCNKRKATIKYALEGGFFAVTHGFYEDLCKRCCLELQIKYAEEHKNDLKNFREELRRLKD